MSKNVDRQSPSEWCFSSFPDYFCVGLLRTSSDPVAKPWLAERCADNAMSPCPLPTSPSERTASTIVLSTRADVDPNGGCFDESPRFRPLQVFGPCCDADSWKPQLVPCTCQCLMERMPRHRPFHNDVLMCQCPRNGRASRGVLLPERISERSSTLNFGTHHEGCRRR